ncbi:hypothetical protein ACFIN9_41045 [Streptomyces noursei]|uniref:hypothetical protein n=1 Tax=Streptomyces noursei TaxID=1971 RepID=UPI0036D3798B
MPVLTRATVVLSAAAAIAFSLAAHAGPAPTARTELAAEAATPTPKIVASGWAEDHKVASATCPAGTGLVGGGFDSHNTRNRADQNTDSVEESAPSATKSNTWLVQLSNGDAKSFAMCVPGAPTPKTVASEWVADGGWAYATCPKGTALIGGGTDSTPSKNGPGAVTDAQQVNAPSGKKANTWMAQMMNGSSKAFAMCVK